MQTPKQPSQCLRCQGLLVQETDPSLTDQAWRCLNCGARGEGMELWGTVEGFYARAVHSMDRLGIKQDHHRRRNYGRRGPHSRRKYEAPDENDE